MDCGRGRLLPAATAVAGGGGGAMVATTDVAVTDAAATAPGGGMAACVGAAARRSGGVRVQCMPLSPSSTRSLMVLLPLLGPLFLNDVGRK